VEWISDFNLVTLFGKPMKDRMVSQTIDGKVKQISIGIAMFNNINFTVVRANTHLAFLYPGSLDYSWPWEKAETENCNIVRETIIKEIRLL
jgi:cytochrome P450